MEDVGIFTGHLVHFTVFCYILWTFGVVRGIWVYFFPFWYFVLKNLATLGNRARKKRIKSCWTIIINLSLKWAINFD
jgi:hypothetical protein